MDDLVPKETSIGYNVLIHGFERSGIPHSDITRAKISSRCKLNCRRGDAHYTKSLNEIQKKRFIDRIKWKRLSLQELSGICLVLAS